MSHLRREDPAPLWLQLMCILREDIRCGRLSPDQGLPSETELCDLYGVSRTVVREALRELTQQNLIYAIKGKGTFVSPRHTEVNFIGSATGSADDLRRFGRRVTTQILEQELGQADQGEAEKLLVAEGTPIVRLTRLRRVDDIPWMLTRAVLPARLVQGLEKLNLENNSLYNILRRNYSLQTAGADRWINAVFASESDAALLEIDTHTPALGIDSISWLSDGTRFEVYYALHRCDNVRFHIGIR